jgi:cytochrome c biogenesis protein CcmG/thiol:disulfide interchange protein DsbE
MSKRLVFFLPLAAIAAMLSLFAFALLTGVNPQEMDSALEGRTMPEFRLTDVNDSDVTLTEESLVGDPYLMNFWATWCPSCKWEHPYLNSLASEGVRIIGINYKDDRELAVEWLRDYANPYDIDVYDPNGDLGFELGVTGAPETFFVDSSGTIQHRFQGPIDSALWESKLKAIYDAME